MRIDIEKNILYLWVEGDDAENEKGLQIITAFLEESKAEPVKTKTINKRKEG